MTDIEKGAELYEKILRIQSHITETIKEHGDISQFKEDVLYVMHTLLEKQLTPPELTVTEICMKNMEYEIQKQKELKYESYIAELKTKIEEQQEEIRNLKKQQRLPEGEDYIFGENSILDEIEKKDKIINLMAERLTTPINSKEWVIDYYKRKVE